MRSVVEALECGVCRIIGRDRVVIPAILAIVIVDAGLQPVQIDLVVGSLDQQLRVIGSIVVVACEGDILAILVGVDDILLDGAVQLAEPTDLVEIGLAVRLQLIDPIDGLNNGHRVSLHSTNGERAAPHSFYFACASSKSTMVENISS